MDLYPTNGLPTVAGSTAASSTSASSSASSYLLDNLSNSSSSGSSDLLLDSSMNTVLRDSMKLDFSNTARQLQPPTSSFDPLQTANIISTLLKSPDVEKLTRDLLVASCNIGATPTTDILFPMEVTKEQKQYAQGFIDALRVMQQQDNFKNAPLNSPSLLDRFSQRLGLTASLTPLASPTNNVLSRTHAQDFDAIIQAIQLVGEHDKSNFLSNKMQSCALPSHSAANTMPSSSTSSISSLLYVPTSSSSTRPPPSVDAQPALKRPKPEASPMGAMSDDEDNVGSSEESLPSTSSRTNSVMSNRRRKDSAKTGGSQMMQNSCDKVARKRERNRLAATKCRQKKLDRIKELEEKLNDEKKISMVLDQQMEQMRQDIQQWRDRHSAHWDRGCRP